VTDRVDVFAFGVMLWECLARRQPWRELSAMQIIFAVGIQVGFHLHDILWHCHSRLK
jgi:hypothetical protein